jgi:hypothetical protein
MPAMEDIVLVRQEKTRQLLHRIAYRPVLCCFCLVAPPAHAQRAKRVFRIVRRAKRKGWILQTSGASIF